MKKIMFVCHGNICRSPMAVFGNPDAFKVRSCMTLFKHAVPEFEGNLQVPLDKVVTIE